MSRTILFTGGIFSGLIIPASTIAQIPKDPDGTGTGFLLRLLGRDGALYTYHLKGNIASHVSTIHTEASLEGSDYEPEIDIAAFNAAGMKIARQVEDEFAVNALLSDPRTFRRKDGTP